MERILAVLTPEQSRRWSEMAGEPIRGPLSTFPAAVRLAARPRSGRPADQHANRTSRAAARERRRKNQRTVRDTRRRIASLTDRGLGQPDRSRRILATVPARRQRIPAAILREVTHASTSSRRGDRRCLLRDPPRRRGAAAVAGRG